MNIPYRIQRMLKRILVIVLILITYCPVLVTIVPDLMYG